MKGSSTTIILSIIGLIVVIGMLGYIFIVKPQIINKSSVGSSNTSASTADISPTVAEKDFAPGIPMAQKTTILIMSSDSTEEKYIVPKDQVDTYSKHLPPGYHVVSK